MKISLFQGVLLGVFSVAALIGLFVFATYTSNNTGGASAVGEVVVWGTLDRDRMQATLVAAAQIEPTLKGVSYVRKEPSTLAGELASAIATGASPDLVLASQEELLALSKYLTPIPYSTLSARTFQNSFAAGANIFGALGENYFGVPFLIDPMVLFANRSILASSGIARPPSTWEELTGLVPNVVRTASGRQITRGLIALGTYSNVENARGILSTLFLQTGVPVTGYTSTGVLTADLGSSQNSGVPPGQAVLRFYSQFADPTKVSYTWSGSLPNSERFFQTGDLALYLGYASRARYLREANPNLDFVVVPVPQPATARDKSAYGLIYAFMISRGAPNPSGAYQAAALLTNPALQEAAAGATGLAPASLTELAKQPADPVLAVGYASALYTRGWLSPPPSDTDPIFSSMITNVNTGRTTLETALSLAERQLSALLQ